MPVSEEDLAKVLEAGRLEPSAKNWQPWNFVGGDRPQPAAGGHRSLAGGVAAAVRLGQQGRRFKVPELRPRRP